MEKKRTIEVKFKCKQGAEDLFYSPETKRVYARQPANVDDIVFWYTTCKWSQGYEADCPIRAGITMRVLDYKGKVCFRETLEPDTWNGGTSAKKKGRFYDETLKKLARSVERQNHLKSYEDWSKWLCSFQEQFGNKDYRDNWLHWNVLTVSDEKIAEYELLDGPAYLYKQTRKHEICGKEWVEYEIRDKDDDVLAICGYKFRGGLK